MYVCMRVCVRILSISLSLSRSVSRCLLFTFACLRVRPSVGDRVCFCSTIIIIIIFKKKQCLGRRLFLLVLAAGVLIISTLRKCVERKNKRHESWSAIKLYLLSQVEALAFSRYGGEEGLDEELEKRQHEKRRRKEAKTEKAMKQLRKQTIKPRWLKSSNAQVKHVHDFEDEVYHEDTDMWSKKCKTCEHSEEYEKM